MNATDLAYQLKADLAPACERIAIAGSIRRGKANPKDIEIVAIPFITQVTIVDMFGEKHGTYLENDLDERLGEIADVWPLDRQLPRNGPRYKRLRHTASGICCDLFITSLESWGVIYTIRTGPADFVTKLVTRALRLGMKVHNAQLWRVHRDGALSVVPTPEERQFFEALGLPYLEPAERTVKVLAQAVAR